MWREQIYLSKASVPRSDHTHTDKHTNIQMELDNTSLQYTPCLLVCSSLIGRNTCNLSDMTKLIWLDSFLQKVTAGAVIRVIFIVCSLAVIFLL